MEREQLEKMNTFSSSVERNKASSQVCKKLFPAWFKPPTQGELQRIIIKGWERSATEEQLLHAGNWWMWARNLMVENVFSKAEKEVTLDIAVNSAINNIPVHFVLARSPELLHCQLTDKDTTLPRSRKVLEKLKKIEEESSTHLPTTITVILADLAITNIRQIKEVCDPNSILEENIQRLKELSLELHIPEIQFLRMSELSLDGTPLSSLVNQDGSSTFDPHIDQHKERLIEIAWNESHISHERLFGWSEEETRTHNRNLAITMGLVGKAVKEFTPPAILIHNESFISRGELNNLFTGKDPLPVFCLNDLLAQKA
jgi:hypothetical protein